MSSQNAFKRMIAMNEKTKAWTSGPATTKHQTPDRGSVEVPAAFQEMADKGIAQTKDTLVNAKAATEEATNVVENTYGAAFKGARDYNLKVLEIARINTNTTFDYAQQLFGVKSPSEFVELAGTRARKQFETMTSQTKELSDVVQKTSSEIVEPIKAGISRAFNKGA
jgi:phasin